MDKYEFNIKVEQIKKLVNKNDYETAIKIADSIDWRRVRNANLLSMVAEVYEKNDEYQEAKDILLIAFERAPIGKRLLFKLTELALKEGSLEEAEAYYREFCDLAPDDSRQHLLRYLILSLKGAPIGQLIHSLESYTAEELDEKWLYELASLYHDAGDGEHCVNLCDKIMLMFGLGKYVDKAMALKQQYAPLTQYQVDLVENRDKYEAKLREVQLNYHAEPGAARNYEPDEEYESESDGGPVQIMDEEPQYQEARRGEPSIEQLVAAADRAAYAHAEPEMIPETMIDVAPEVIDGQELVMAVKQAEVEEHLAEQMSRITFGDQPEDDTPGGQTRILGDLRALKMTAPEPDVALSAEPEPITRSGRKPEAARGAKVVRLPAAETAAAKSEGTYLMIESRTPEKGLERAVEMLKELQISSGIKNPVAKISGSRLNKKGMLASADKLRGKDLIIEEAGDLAPDTIEELAQFMEQSEGCMRVLLLDNPKQMDRLRDRYAGLLQMFSTIGIDNDEPQAEPAVEEPPVTIRAAEAKPVDNRPVRRVTPAREEYQKPYKKERTVPAPAAEVVSQPAPAVEDEMDIDEFAQYACRYAGEIDCSITGKSMLALYERIEIMEEDGIPLTKSSAEELIEEAADRAEKPSLGKLITGVFSSKYDKDGLLILKEEHFI